VQALGGNFSRADTFRAKRKISYSVFIFKNETVREINQRTVEN